MIFESLKYYEIHSKEIAYYYEKVDLTDLQNLILNTFPIDADILELGCGSGRDVSFLIKKGYDATATDGSKAMLNQAVSLHPELKGRTRLLVLPGKVPWADASFDGVYAIAVLMHLELEGIKQTLAEVRRLLKPGGKFLFSVPSKRGDVGESGFDDKGRRFTMLPPDEWQRLGVDTGFELVDRKESADSLGRADVSWLSFVFRKSAV